MSYPASQAVVRALPGVRLRDLVELGKPRITAMVLLTTALGMWLAPGWPGTWPTLLFLAATGCLVASANTLNCWVERDTDGRMRRTRDRPLPAGRLEPLAALISGAALGTIAVGLLWWTTNPLTAGLGALALVSYVAIYTPLKRFTPWAVVIGAVPGAIPPLMGWTAVTGSLATAGWVLFGLLFLWQLPHFIAISIYLAEDYRRGGLRVFPVVHGEPAARRQLFGWTVLLVAFSAAPVPLGLAGGAYLAVALLLGAGFLRVAWPAGSGAWARRVFLYSLVYLPLLFVALILDAR